MGRFEHGRSSFNDHVRDHDKDNDPRDRGRFRYLGLHGLRLDSSSAAAANAVIFRLFDTYATPMDGRSTSIAGQL
jgi:hypothetical protein